MKKLLALVMILVSFATVAYADELVVPEGIPAVVHSNTLSLREEPSTSSHRVESLSNGDFVIIPYDRYGNVESNGYDMVRVWHNGNYGWVLEKLLTKNPKYLVSADKTPKAYASPSMMVEITDHLDPEETLLILEELQGGYIVNFRKTAAFVQYGENTYLYERVGEEEYNYLDLRWGYTNDEAELYNEPDDDSAVMGIYPEDSPITLSGEESGFYKVGIGEEIRYVEKDVVDLH